MTWFIWHCRINELGIMYAYSPYYLEALYILCTYGVLFQAHMCVYSCLSLRGPVDPINEWLILQNVCCTVVGCLATLFGIQRGMLVLYCGQGVGMPAPAIKGKLSIFHSILIVVLLVLFIYSSIATANSEYCKSGCTVRFSCLVSSNLVCYDTTFSWWWICRVCRRS